ncbi:MAG: Gfo/Idh/MocA family oxidoreductase [Gammaproteobacteria bacterium]|nr:Gfo/Idh/MocA family oxidoreductase [Gammaproteobacteria bacterium]
MAVKIAMIATGRIAETQLAPAIAAAPGAELWSVLSRDKSRAQAFADKHGAGSSSPAYTDLNALLADDELDAVLIASPDKLHAEQAIAAARAGKHVLCEKPMTTDNEASQAMLEACDKAGVKFAIAYHMRWHDGHRKLAAAAHAGKFGTLRHMRVQWPMQSSPDNWRAGTELGRWWPLSGVGTHCLDQIRWFMCKDHGEVVRLQSLITREVYKGPHEETAVLAMQFESGATAEMCNSVLFPGPRLMELYGSDGFALCENTLGPDGGGSIRTHEGTYAFEVVNPYVGEVVDFVRAIEENREPEVTGAEGARNVALLLEAVS